MLHIHLNLSNYIPSTFRPLKAQRHNRSTWNVISIAEQIRCQDLSKGDLWFSIECYVTFLKRAFSRRYSQRIVFLSTFEVTEIISQIDIASITSMFIFLPSLSFYSSCAGCLNTICVCSPLTLCLLLTSL